jgi:hypothetical protein
MRSSLLQLASFQLAVLLLAAVPVRLIFLALNACIHVNQFVHSLYPRPLPLRNMLPGLSLPSFHPLAITNSRDATSEHIHFVRKRTCDLTVHFANSDSPAGNDLVVQIAQATVDGPTVESCIGACEGFSLAGVENQTGCCTCFAS